MNRWGAVAALVGVAILGVVIARSDLAEVGRNLALLTPAKVAVLVALYFVGRLGGAMSWLLTMTVEVSPTWFARILRVHLIGGAVENLTPLAGLGGEPVKAMILKRDYGVGLREASVSLALTRMTDLAAILLFCMVGTAAASLSARDDHPLRQPAALALAFLVLGGLAAFLLQRARVLGRTTARLRQWLGERGRYVLDAVVDVESRIAEAYADRPGRLVLSVVATFLEWVMEAVLIWTCLVFLSAPASAATALVIAAFALVVRSAFFFVPANLGTQEAALVAVCGALVGTSALGLAIAAVIRLGEVMWTAVGVAIGLPYVFGRRVSVSAEAGD
jgi:uncharacterized protein (TIRG00374 family)